MTTKPVIGEALEPRGRRRWTSLLFACALGLSGLVDVAGVRGDAPCLNYERFCRPHLASYRDRAGRQLALLTVQEFSPVPIDPAASADTDEEHFEVLHLTIANTGDAPLALDPTRFFGAGRAMVYEGTAPDAYPDRSPLRAEVVPPGRQITRDVFFRVRGKDSVRAVYYQPAPDRLIFLTDGYPTGGASDGGPRYLVGS